MSHQQVPFFKMTGAGNDFIFFNEINRSVRASLEAISNRREFARRICARGLGVGADGVVFLRPDQTRDFQWDFFNSDGSDAEMCGNAARCAISLMFQLGQGPSRMRFLTGAGEVHGQFNPDKSISVVMPMAGALKPEAREIILRKQTLGGKFINTGVPHFVIETESPTPQEELRALAQQVRHHESFGPKGTNVTFLNRTSEIPRSFSFERGVEDFTLACGTGAVAAGLVYSGPSGLKGREVEIRVPGGSLFVSQEAESGKPILRGPAVVVFVGQLNPGAFHV